MASFYVWALVSLAALGADRIVEQCWPKRWLRRNHMMLFTAQAVISVIVVFGLIFAFKWDRGL